MKRSDPRQRYLCVLNRLAERKYPVAGAAAAAAHLRRGQAHESIEAVLTAIDNFIDAGQHIPEPSTGHQPNTYGELVSALTVYVMNVERSMG